MLSSRTVDGLPWRIESLFYKRLINRFRKVFCAEEVLVVVARSESEEDSLDRLQEQKTQTLAREGHSSGCIQGAVAARRLTGPAERCSPASLLERAPVVHGDGEPARSIVDRLFLNGLELNVVIITSHPYLKAVLTLALFSSFLSAAAAAAAASPGEPSVCQQKRALRHTLAQVLPERVAHSTAQA